MIRRIGSKRPKKSISLAATEEQPNTSSPLSRSFLTPAAIYVGAQLPDPVDPNTPYTVDEKNLLVNASSKLMAESEALLRAWRTEGSLVPQGAQPDAMTGKWPAPSLALIGELTHAVGMIGTDPDAVATSQDLELARLEVEIEKERLALEREQVALTRTQVEQGMYPSLTYTTKQSASTATPMLLAARARLDERRARSQARRQRAQARQVQSAQARYVSAGRRSISNNQLMSRSSALEMGDAEQLQGYANDAYDGLNEIADTSTPFQQLLECLKTALCDFINCFLSLTCAGGEFTYDAETFTDQLMSCLGTAFCRLLNCLVALMCPPNAPECAIPAPSGCTFAIEGGS